MESFCSNNDTMHLSEVPGFESGPFIIRNGCAEWTEYMLQEPTGPTKEKRTRTTFTTEQLSALEMFYRRNNFADRVRLQQVAAHLGLPEKPVKIWFQNRRMRAKKGYLPATQDSEQSLPPPVPCNGNPAVHVVPAEHRHSSPPTAPCRSRQIDTCESTPSLDEIPRHLLLPAQVQQELESFDFDAMLRTYLYFDDSVYIKFKPLT